MAFLDKISNAGQAAGQKMQNMAAVSRLNGAISEEEKRVNNTYFQIGKLYYSKHQNDFEADFSGMFATLADSEKKIADYKQQIKDIKGIAVCEHCGAEVSNNIAFCSACGKPMKNANIAFNPDLVKCSACGAMVDKNMRFCTSCGNPMPAAAPAAPAPAAQPAAPVAPAPAPVPVVAPQPVAPVEPAVAPVQPSAAACANCGAPLEAGAAFCTGCGTPVGAPVAPVAPAQPATNKCPGCGAEVADDSVFCTACGYKLK